MAELRRTVGARQAHYGIFDGLLDGDGSSGWHLPWTLRESFGEYSLSRELARPGELIEEVPDSLSWREQFDLLARHEGTPTLAEQEAEIARLDAEYDEQQRR